MSAFLSIHFRQFLAKLYHRSTKSGAAAVLRDLVLQYRNSAPDLPKSRSTLQHRNSVPKFPRCCSTCQGLLASPKIIFVILFREYAVGQSVQLASPKIIFIILFREYAVGWSIQLASPKIIFMILFGEYAVGLDSFSARNPQAAFFQRKGPRQPIQLLQLVPKLFL